MVYKVLTHPFTFDILLVSAFEFTTVIGIESPLFVKNSVTISVVKTWLVLIGNDRECLTEWKLHGRLRFVPLSFFSWGFCFKVM